MWSSLPRGFIGAYSLFWRKNQGFIMLLKSWDHMRSYMCYLWKISSKIPWTLRIIALLFDLKILIFIGWFALETLICLCLSISGRNSVRQSSCFEFQSMLMFSTFSCNKNIQQHTAFQVSPWQSQCNKNNCSQFVPVSTLPLSAGYECSWFTALNNKPPWRA